VAIVLDKSGSMTGAKLEKAKEAAIAAIERLSEKDIVSVVAYDSQVKVIVPATKLADKHSVISQIRQMTGGGSTALFAGVSQGSAEIRKFLKRDCVNRIILLSDGLANVGPQSPSELGELGASLLREGIAVSTMGLGLDYNEDLMTQLARRSGGNHVFIEQADDLVQIFNYEFDDVLSVVAQEVLIEVVVADGIRPVRVLNVDAEITGQQILIKMNQLYSGQEKYVLVELEVPSSQAGSTREVAQVNVSYANLATKTTDRLSNSVGVNFHDSPTVVEQNANKEVGEACALQIANEQNELATQLRDRGEINKAREVLLRNSAYLEEQAKKLESRILLERGAANEVQAKNVDSPLWSRYRKLMRQQQYSDLNQQGFDGTKLRAPSSE
jgi:Ca-activated chloride channel family protein